MSQTKATAYLIAVMALAIGGCGVAAKAQARDEMMQSKQKYTACLAQNGSEPGRCAGLKDTYEANLKPTGLHRNCDDTT
jgi:hypothetical protein